MLPRTHQDGRNVPASQSCCVHVVRALHACRAFVTLRHRVLRVLRAGTDGRCRQQIRFGLGAAGLAGRGQGARRIFWLPLDGVSFSCAGHMMRACCSALGSWPSGRSPKQHPPSRKPRTAATCDLRDKFASPSCGLTQACFLHTHARCSRLFLSLRPRQDVRQSAYPLRGQLLRACTRDSQVGAATFGQQEAKKEDVRHLVEDCAERGRPLTPRSEP